MKYLITIFEILIGLKFLILISQIIIDPFPNKQKPILSQSKKHFHILLKKGFDNFALMSGKSKGNEILNLMNIGDPSRKILAARDQEPGIW